MEVLNKSLSNKVDKVLSDLQTVTNKVNQLEAIQDEHTSSLKFYGKKIEEIKSKSLSIHKNWVIQSQQSLQRQLLIVGVPHKL